MKKCNGISLITLIVTIMVMLILIGVVGTYSLDTINEGNRAVAAREFADVQTYVVRHSTRLEMEEFNIDVTKYPEIVLSPELVYLICDGKLNSTEINNIVDVNSADIDDKCKYYYFQAEEKIFEDSKFTSGDITLQDVSNDYIINFYTKTIICVSDGNFKVEGLIKSLGEILVDME